MRVLVSGFEPFGGETINPSALLIRELESAELKQGLTLSTVLLPVVFCGAYERLRETIETVRPDVVIALGQAGGRKALSVERVAVNVMDATQPDNDGSQPLDEPVVADGPAAYFSTLPIKEIVRAVQDAGIESEVSNSAGTYVCNDLMYRLLHAHPEIRSGFVHLPYLPEQAARHEGAPSMELSRMAKGILAILGALI